MENSVKDLTIIDCLGLSVQGGEPQREQRRGTQHARMPKRNRNAGRGEKMSKQHKRVVHGLEQVPICPLAGDCLGELLQRDFCVPNFCDMGDKTGENNIHLCGGDGNACCVCHCARCCRLFQFLGKRKRERSNIRQPQCFDPNRSVRQGDGGKTATF